MDNFEYKGYTYLKELDVEPDNIKIFHMAVKEGKEVHIDFSPYTEMDFETFQMLVDLNFPERIGVKTPHGTFFSPWNKDSLMKFWLERKV
jgi:hypothetical protein